MTGWMDGWMDGATVACSDWHSKIDFHYIFVGGIGHVIMVGGGNTGRLFGKLKR